MALIKPLNNSFEFKQKIIEIFKKSWKKKFKNKKHNFDILITKSNITNSFKRNQRNQVKIMIKKRF